MSKILLVMGKRGSGKTTLAKKLIALLPRNKNIFIYDTLGEYSGIGTLAENIETVFDYLETEERIIRFTSDDDDDFDRICRVIYSLKDYYLLVDEIDMFISAVYLPEFFKKIIRYGRHSGLGIIAVTRRPADISRLLSSQANFIISFKQHEPKDCQYFSSFMPDTEKLLELNEYEYLCYNSDKQTMTKNMVNIS